MAIRERRGRAWVSALSKAGKLRLRGAGGQEGRNQRFLPSCQSPLFPDAQAGGRNGCAVPISDQDRSEKIRGLLRELCSRGG